MQAVIAPLTSAASGIDIASAAVAAQPIEQKASANVATRDEVWRRRNWLRLACTRNQSWIAAAEIVAMMMAAAVIAACNAETNASATTSGANTAPIAISTTSILARRTRDGGIGAVATRSTASSPDIVSQARPPASWPAAITITGVIRMIAADESEKLRHSISAGGTR